MGECVWVGVCVRAYVSVCVCMCEDGVCVRVMCVGGCVFEWVVCVEGGRGYRDTG